MKIQRAGALFSVLVVFTLLSACAVHAATGAPNILNYQGTLQDDAGNPVTGEKVMSFRIYPGMDTLQSGALWSSGALTLRVDGGRFSVNLGDTIGVPPKIPPQPPFPADLFNDDSRYLGVSVDGTELIERKRLVSVPYALVSLNTINTGVSEDGWQAANEAWTYSSTDSPSFVFTVSGNKISKYSPGMRIKLSQSTVKYFIITKVEYQNPNTFITVFGGTDYDLDNAVIADSFYSCVKISVGFPLDPTKWTVEVTDNALRTQSSPSAGVWYNLGGINLSVPIGLWQISWVAGLNSGQGSGVTNLGCYGTLSTSNNSESDKNLTGYWRSAIWNFEGTFGREKTVRLDEKTTYYFNISSPFGNITSISIGNTVPLVIRAVCLYL